MSATTFRVFEHEGVVYEEKVFRVTLSKVPCAIYQWKSVQGDGTLSSPEYYAITLDGHGVGNFDKMDYALNALADYIRTRKRR